MDWVSRCWSPAKSALLERLARKSLALPRERAFVSFSFDDVPRSALDGGLPLLDRSGFRASFYVAPAMGRSGGGRYLEACDLRRLHSEGHDVACHTDSHYSLRKGSARGLLEDALRGKQKIEDAIGAPVDHFSYPFGEVSVAAKRALGGVFRTLRTSSPGINRGRVDLSCLRAHALYHRSFDPARLRAVVDSVAASGGWLIFYTHGVRGDPSAWDCTPSELELAADLAGQSGATVLSVAEVWNRLSSA